MTSRVDGDWRPAEAISSSSAARAAAARTSSPALLGSHPRFADVPIEARFHCNKRGMPDLLEGRVSLAAFWRSCASFWWHRVRVDDQPRGLYNLHDAGAVRRRGGALRARLPRRPGRRLPRSSSCDLLWPLASEEGKPGLVEMSSHNVREAQTLRRLFPEARFVHAVRDGRDAASSVTTKTWGPGTHRAGDRLVGRPPARDRGRRPRRGGRRRLRAPARALCVVVLDDLVVGRPRGAPTPAARLPRGRRRRRHARVLRRRR